MSRLEWNTVQVGARFDLHTVTKDIRNAEFLGVKQAVLAVGDDGSVHSNHGRLNMTEDDLALLKNTCSDTIWHTEVRLVPVFLCTDSSGNRSYITGPELVSVDTIDEAKEPVKVEAEKKEEKEETAAQPDPGAKAVAVCAVLDMVALNLLQIKAALQEFPGTTRPKSIHKELAMAANMLLDMAVAYMEKEEGK